MYFGALWREQSDFCGRNGRWKGLIFRHNRVFVQNQGAVLKKSSLRRVHPGDFPSRQGENERRPISCAHSSWIKRSTLLCRKMTRVHPVLSFPPKFPLKIMYNNKGLSVPVSILNPKSYVISTTHSHRSTTADDSSHPTIIPRWDESLCAT